MRAALSFLTCLGRSGRPGPGTLDWFPVVGAALGLVLGVIWWGAEHLWPAPVAAAVVVAADLALTGLLHLDGLVDSADGLLPHLPRDRRLEVMRSPETGAFGVGAAGAILLLRFAGLASVRADMFLIGGLWCLSRTLMAVVVRTRRYARSEGGLVSAFTAPGSPRDPTWSRWPPLVMGLAGGLALLAAWRPGPGLLAGACALLAGGGVIALAERRVVGYTGDVLGASAMLAETAGLIVAAAKW